MSEPNLVFPDDDLRLEIDPEPSPEELVVILEVVRSLHGADETDQPNAAPVRSNWAEIARQEALRPAAWPTQRAEWTLFRR